MNVMSPRRPTARPPDHTTAARAELARCIAKHRALLDELAGLSIALESGALGFDAVRALEQRVTAARENLGAAKTREHENLIAAALGRAVAPGLDEKSAASDLEAAETALAKLRNARQAAQQRQSSAQTDVDAAKLFVDLAVRELLHAHVAPDIGRLIDRVNEIYIEAGELSNCLDWLLGHAADAQGPNAHPQALEAACRFTSFPRSWPENEPTRSVSRGKWDAARAALLTDASAPLPQVFEP
jgi:hypothetical protein